MCLKRLATQHWPLFFSAYLNKKLSHLEVLSMLHLKEEKKLQCQSQKNQWDTRNPREIVFSEAWFGSFLVLQLPVRFEDIGL